MTRNKFDKLIAGSLCDARVEQTKQYAIAAHRCCILFQSKLLPRSKWWKFFERRVTLSSSEACEAAFHWLSTGKLNALAKKVITSRDYLDLKRIRQPYIYLVAREDRLMEIERSNRDTSGDIHLPLWLYNFIKEV
tara:strand:- start:13423 stop:13827 length:405 start_codon:yes stop_codon:yes gene_type:complete